MKNAIILCSGGLDSATTSYYAKKTLNYQNIIILFFNYQQRTITKEREASQKIAKQLGAEFKEINLKELSTISTSLINSKEQVKQVRRKELKDTKEESDKYYVPCRNTIFLTYALALSESLQLKKKGTWDIFTGFKSEGKETYPDTTKAFVKKINELRKTSTSVDGEIKAPLIEKDKDEIITLAQKLGVKLEDTYSCYANDKMHCGVCLACRLRQEAFYWANIPDKTKYKVKMKDYRKA